MATKGFLDAQCAGGNVTHKNETDGECTKIHNVTTEVDRVHCDGKGKQKYFSYFTNISHSSPYEVGKDCKFALTAWEAGQEAAHKGSCGKHVDAAQIELV